MALDREYKIGTSSRACAACDCRFGVGDEYYSAVVEVEGDEVLARHDFCPGCWKPDGGPYFSFWKTRVPQPEQAVDRGPRLVDLGRLMQLFEHLVEQDEEHARRFRYVLGLVLMRKRRLKVVSSRRLAGGKGEELTLRETGTDRQHVVACPSISDDEIRSVADRLREILDMPETWDEIPAAQRQAGPDASAPVGGADEPEDTAEENKEDAVDDFNDENKFDDEDDVADDEDELEDDDDDLDDEDDDDDLDDEDDVDEEDAGDA